MSRSVVTRRKAPLYVAFGENSTYFSLECRDNLTVPAIFFGVADPERQKVRPSNELADKKPATHHFAIWYSVSDDGPLSSMPNIRLGRNRVAGAADVYWFPC